MTLWLDAQLSPKLSPWIAGQFGVACVSVRDLGLRDESDRRIFLAARRADAVIVTKDSDFRDLLASLGPPPSVVWLTIGNTSSDRLRAVFAEALPTALAYVSGGEVLVEIADRPRG
ncbi:MAG: DUF5615 family PIN-like protein [Armatimonadetes bacterium]|nr:DUF5615 family PIN-like protein [Armatimonadota bacterium]